MTKRVSIQSDVLYGELEENFLDAVYNHNILKISECLDRGVNPNMLMSKSRKTALHFAAERGDTTFTSLLLKCKNIDVNLANDRGFSALHLACSYSYSEVVMLIIENGACKDCRNTNQRTPLHLSAGFGDNKTTKILINHGANPNVLDTFNSTPLSIAALDSANYELTKIIFECADPVFDRSPQMQLFLELVLYAEGFEHIKIITLFLEHEKLNINMVDENFGKTCLHYVALTGYFELAYLLLSYGADRSVRDTTGRLPLQTAMEYKNYEIIRLFQEFLGPTFHYIPKSKSIFSKPSAFDLSELS